MYDLTSCLCVWAFRYACSDLKKRLWEDDKFDKYQREHKNPCASEPHYPSLCPDKDTRVSRKAGSHYNNQDKFPVKLLPINFIGIYLKRWGIGQAWKAWKYRLWVGTWKRSLEQSQKTAPTHREPHPEWVEPWPIWNCGSRVAMLRCDSG